MSIENEKKGILLGNNVYKPFRYPWAHQFWETQQRVHWLPEEVPLAEDVQDWNKNLTPQEKNLVTQIFRFFTQADCIVADAYINHYLRIFKPTEVQMMMTTFASMETVHITAYSHLLDTIGMPEVEYQAFLKYKEMKDKVDYFASINPNDKKSIAKTVAIFSAFTEGLQLFASFAILLNFPRHGKLKGMGQVVTWSVRDETIHVNGMLKVFHTFIEENPEIWNDELKQEIYQACTTIVSHEDAFVDLAFEQGPLQDCTADDIKKYIRYIANRRLIQLGLNPIYEISQNPLPWLDVMLNSQEHANFFEQRATEYSKASTKGDWDNVF